MKTITAIEKMTAKIKVRPGFTIVELLVVIVTIGILAAITIVSYTGIANRATAASLQSDLANGSQQISVFQATDSSGNYPTAINCSNTGTTEICLKSSNGNSYMYASSNSTSPKTFSLIATNGLLSYQTTQDIAPTDMASASSGWKVGIAGTVLAGKYVRSADIPNAQYKTSSTVVTSPQGATGLDPNYSSKMSLVSPQANPTVDFSEYTAQNTFRAIGGRLPTMQELVSMYTNRATYGGFQSATYWSATQSSSNLAYGVAFDTSSSYATVQTIAFNVRCVSGG